MLSESNFKRICLINWFFTGPVLLLFAVPYIEVGRRWIDNRYLLITGALLFSTAFMITVLHAHVTMALGKSHRHHYYTWLGHHPWTYGLGFRPFMINTRFRFFLLALGLVSIAIR